MADIGTLNRCYHEGFLMAESNSATRSPYGNGTLEYWAWLRGVNAWHVQNRLKRAERAFIYLSTGTIVLGLCGTAVAAWGYLS